MSPVGTFPTCQLHQAMSALFVLSNLRFVPQHGVQKRTMNLDFSVVIDKAPFSKFVHEEADSRSSGADHFRQRSLAEGHRDRHRTVFVAEIRQKQEKASEASFAGIEQLVDRVI